MKRILLACAFALASLSAHAQFSVIRGLNPSQQFVNLNADSSGNIAVNCVVGCGASAGTGGLAANGSAVSGNPVLIAGYDGSIVRTIKTDTSGQANINIVNTPAVTVASTTLSGTSNNVIVSASTNTLVDKSGTITTGGTSQTLSSAKSRHYLFIQNVSTGNLYINFTSAAAATSGSITLLPNSSFVQEGSFVTSEVVTVFGATTGQAFTAKEF